MASKGQKAAKGLRIHVTISGTAQTYIDWWRRTYLVGGGKMSAASVVGALLDHAAEQDKTYQRTQK